MSLKKNNKGYSLIELLTVIAILGIATALVSGSLVSVFRARSQKAAETVDALLAQAKIDALSGVECVLMLGYNEDNDVYVAEILRQGGDTMDYKYEEIGNGRLAIKAGGTALDENVLVVKFNRTTGAVDYANVMPTDLDDTETLDEETFISFFGTRGTSLFGSDVTGTISFDSIGSHSITLYKGTGEHTLDA